MVLIKIGRKGTQFNTQRAEVEEGRQENDEWSEWETKRLTAGIFKVWLISFPFPKWIQFFRIIIIPLFHSISILYDDNATIGNNPAWFIPSFIHAFIHLFAVTLTNITICIYRTQWRLLLLYNIKLTLLSNFVLFVRISTSLWVCFEPFYMFTI